jgi:dsRNA-specific ribonuclease
MKRREQTVSQLQIALQDILSDEDQKHVLNNKRLAKLGDALINFLYSVAKSIVAGEFCGEKVSDRSLAAALRETSLKEGLRSRRTVDDLGDAVEAFCAHLWIKQLVSLEEMVSVLINAINDLELGHHKAEKVAERRAFKTLIEYLLTKRKSTEVHEQEE